MCVCEKGKRGGGGRKRDRDRPRKKMERREREVLKVKKVSRLCLYFSARVH